MAPVPLVNGLGVMSAFFTSGIYFSATSMMIPALAGYEPTMKASYFKKFTDAGLKVIAPLTLFSTACSAYTAYALPEQRHAFAFTALASLAPLLYSKFVMEKPFMPLTNPPATGSRLKFDQVDSLLQKWAQMNFVRSAISFVSGVSGLYFAGQRYGAI